MTPSQLECLIARTPDEREQVYRLRYACYRRDQSISERKDAQFSDRFDELPNSFSFLVRTRQQEPAATVRISVVRKALGWHDTPVQHVYGDHSGLQEMAAEGFVEPAGCASLNKRGGIPSSGWSDIWRLWRASMRPDGWSHARE